MKNKLIVGLLACCSLVPSIGAAKDPVAMKINGKDIKLSEFEYLYKKNKQQQLEEQTFDNYIKLFVTYKLKVADAENAGIDTTKTFLNEYMSNRNASIAPFLENKSTNDRLLKEAYERSKEDVDVWHIMLPLEDSNTTGKKSPKHLIDSLRNCLVNGADFSELALKYSVDPSAKRNKGHLGYIRSGMLPYSFEYTAYNTPVNEISKVVETPFGYHIIKTTARRESRGQVLAEHIMKLVPRGASKETAAEMKSKMDSIYLLVKNGADFEELAKKESDDPGSKAQGGRLPWFGAGQMVPEFEAKAFELGKNEICEPFATAYGYHIIKKLDSKGVLPFDEVKEQLLASFKNDERAQLSEKELIDSLRIKYNYKISESAKKEIYKIIDKFGGYDSIADLTLGKSNKTIITFGKEKISIKDIAAKLKANPKLTVDAAKGLVDRTIDNVGNSALFEYHKNKVVTENADLNNLLNEYRDGLLLYEISNRNVWEKSNRDKDGLNKFFTLNKDKYAWDEPRYKGYVIQIANDSVANLVKKELMNISEDTLVSSLSKQFKRNIRIEKVLLPQDKDAKVISAEEGLLASRKKDAKFPIVLTYNAKLINVPEDPSDVKGQVVTDYQNELEEQWVKKLKAKYPVVINYKVLETVK